MSEQKPENKFSVAGKLIGVCVVCIGIVYGIVTLVTALTS
jgi:uncharacterized membrane protein